MRSDHTTRLVMTPVRHGLGALLLATMVCHLRADDFAQQCADRAAIERVYHLHRLATKETFEQVMPRGQIEQLVRHDQRKQNVLDKLYGVKVTSAMIAAEVRRIQTTTRAPEVLAEIQTALGNDAERFALTMAQPIVVERALRQCFENDDRLHAAERGKAESARSSLLNGQSVKGMREVTWLLSARPTQDAPTPPAITTPTTVNAKSGAYTVEATAQLAQVIASPDHAEFSDKKLYFEDLDPELQKVLRAQLKKAGDVSAVIETPGGFLIFQAKETSTETLKVSSLTIPKRSYEEWLAQQPEDKP